MSAEQEDEEHEPNHQQSQIAGEEIPDEGEEGLPLGHGLTAGIGSEGRKPWLRGSLHSLERDGGAEGFPVGCCPGRRMP